MNQIVLLFIISIFGYLSKNVEGMTSSAIPEILYNCYEPNVLTPKQPLTMQLFIEIIRKIELNNEYAFNARILTTSMLHGVILDGIRRSPDTGNYFIPFRATGEEFYKYKLIVDYLTSGDSSLFPVESLSTAELCYLHMMVSNTVDAWERGDESTTCAHQSNMPFELEAMEEQSEFSSCPIKKGTINTKWGSLSVGHIIAAIASAFQPLTATFERIEAAITKNLTDKNVSTIAPTITTNTANVNNVWVSTIAGDLATVVLKQASDAIEIGTAGFWNDTLLPRIYYLKSTNYDMSESDILAGIDGLAIAQYLETNNVARIRLSQLIDMFYSERGILNNEEYKVTNRSFSLNKLLNKITLEEQVANAAKLLQKIGTYDNLLSEQQINALATTAANKFKMVAGNITKTYDSVEAIPGTQIKSFIEMIVIVDGSYDAYSALQIIYGLSEAIQVSYYGSKLGIINGESGNWMATVTGELFQLFTDLEKSKSEWPSVLSLGRSLESVIFYYQNKTATDCTFNITKPMARSILILTKGGRLTDDDFQSSLRAFNSIKKSNPETNFILVTASDRETGFKELTGNFWNNDYILTPPENINSLIQEISKTLSTIPGNFINFYCGGSKLHLVDYITPGTETFYQIRREYTSVSPILTTFSNSNYGNLSICAHGDTTGDEVCKDVTVNDEISFDSMELCASEAACNLDFRVSAYGTEILCLEISCRYPDQVKLDIIWQRSLGHVPGITCYISLILVNMLILIL